MEAVQKSIPVNPAKEIQASLISNFKELDDPFLRYEYLLELAADLPVMPDEDKNRAMTIDGCQSNVWMIAHQDDKGLLVFSFESDTLIIRGILRIMQLIYSQRTPTDILSCPFELPAKSGLDELFETQRRNGIRTIAENIRAKAQKATQNTQ